LRDNTFYGTKIGNLYITWDLKEEWESIGLQSDLEFLLQQFVLIFRVSSGFVREQLYEIRIGIQNSLSL